MSLFNGFFIVLFCMSLKVNAEVYFVGPNKKQYLELIEKVEKRLVGSDRGKKDVFVALGDEGLEMALKANYSPVIAANITRSEYDYIVLSYNACIGCVGAIFWEASPSSYISLSEKIFTKGYFYVLASSRTVIPDHPRVVHIECTGKNLIEELGRVGEDAAAVIAIPDRNIYTPQNLRAIIRFLYRENLPLIGYSESMVSAGALISINHDLSLYADQIFVEIQRILEDKAPREVYPEVNVVKKNRRLARSLGITFPEAIDRKI